MYWFALRHTRDDVCARTGCGHARIHHYHTKRKNFCAGYDSGINSECCECDKFESKCQQRIRLAWFAVRNPTLTLKVFRRHLDEAIEKAKKRSSR